MICATDDTDCNARLGGPYPCAKNIYIGDSCRMPDGTLQRHQSARRSTRTASIASPSTTTSPTAAQGFSGALKRNTTKFNTGISLRDALVDYIRTLPNRCTDPSMYTNVVGVNFCKDAQAETYDCTRPSAAAPTSPPARRSG